MAVDSQVPQEASGKGRVRCTPLQGTEYTNRSTPKPKYNNLEEWFQDVSSVDYSFPLHRKIGFRYPLEVVPCLRWDANNSFFLFCRILG